ncbi:MAG TPA: hypothetical protein VGN72_00845 [Tepidisphaeraceae bacterium]|jgi:hypothetical protein|nr:hypothetical protein [Tepidisphaeraceae bacterium]
MPPFRPPHRRRLKAWEWGWADGDYAYLVTTGREIASAYDLHADEDRFVSIETAALTRETVRPLERVMHFPAQKLAWVPRFGNLSRAGTR